MVNRFQQNEILQAARKPHKLRKQELVNRIRREQESNMRSEYEDILAKIGERIKCSREALGETQTELADKAGISETHLVFLENHRTDSPGLHILYDITKALDRDLIWLISGREFDPEDDHCTYRKTREGYTIYMTSCGVRHNGSIGKKWISCPYCGRPIRRAI